jgi:hypothetical protein
MVECAGAEQDGNGESWRPTTNSRSTQNMRGVQNIMRSLWQENYFRVFVDCSLRTKDAQDAPNATDTGDALPFFLRRWNNWLRLLCCDDLGNLAVLNLLERYNQYFGSDVLTLGVFSGKAAGQELARQFQSPSDGGYDFVLSLTLMKWALTYHETTEPPNLFRRGGSGDDETFGLTFFARLQGQVLECRNSPDYCSTWLPKLLTRLVRLSQKVTAMANNMANYKTDNGRFEFPLTTEGKLRVAFGDKAYLNFLSVWADLFAKHVMGAWSFDPSEIFTQLTQWSHAKFEVNYHIFIIYFCGNF